MNKAALTTFFYHNHKQGEQHHVLKHVNDILLLTFLNGLFCNGYRKICWKV